ncbi:MAG: hypothetical protein Aurels2KO_19700 [Aureliella sp.]
MQRLPEALLVIAILCAWGYALVRHGWALLGISIAVSLIWIAITFVLLIRPPGFPRIDLNGDAGEEEIVSREEMFETPHADWRPKICLAVAASITIALLVCLESAN